MISSANGWIGRGMMVCVAGLLVLGAGGAFAELSSTPREETWMTDGVVRAIVTTPTTAYIGGNFTYVGPNTGSGVVLDAATGTPDLPYAKIYGDVYACVADGAGGWYIGGLFTRVGTAARTNIAHILPDGSVDPFWSPNANGGVNALAVSGATVYVGGDFTVIGGQTRNRIAALDAATGTATAWNPSADSTVNALAVSGTEVYAGGTFTSVGGQTRVCIAALDGVTGIASAWNPGANNTVYALAVLGTTVYAGGMFTAAGGQSRSCIAALDVTTGLATAWNPGAIGPVLSLALSGTTVYIGGGFSNVGGQSRRYIAALDMTTGLATPWDPDASGFVLSLAVSGTTVYAGGVFTTIGGQGRRRVAALDAATGTATAWNPNSDGEVLALAVSGTKVYAGGAFGSIGGKSRSNIAALDAATGAVTDWACFANNTVSALAVSGTTVYAGGDFTSIGGQTRNRIAALDATVNTSPATSWNPNAGGTVSALAVSGTTVYAGGSFTTIGGQTRNRIAALNATVNTNNATAWNPNADNTVSTLAVSGITVYAGGAFSTIGGQPRNRIAALNATVNTNNAMSWNPNAGSLAAHTVSALAVSGTTVYAGGSFTTIGGQARNRIAALDATLNTNNATGWNPNAGNTVSALAVSGTTVYAGGSFTTIGGQPRNRIAALDATVNTNNAMSWNPNAGGMLPEVLALAVSGSTTYVGGTFSTIRGLRQYSPAQFDGGTTPAPPSNPGATAIGMDRIIWTWGDNSAEETGCKVYDDPGAGPPATLQTTTAANATSWEHTGLAPNTLYAFQVAATNAMGDSTKTANFFAWTLAAVAAAPTVTSPSLSTLDVTLGADSNPAGTLYAIEVSPAVGGNTWVQADGSVGVTPIYQSAAAWGTVTVTGLVPSTLYSFTVTARSWDGVNAVAGPLASGTTADVTPPTGTVEINGGAAATNNTAASLALTYDDGAGSGVADMQFSNDNATWSGWEAVAGTKAWTLSVGDGLKTVYVQYRDAAGNVSTDTISDGILLDALPPTAAVTLLDPTPTQATVLNYSLTFSEPVAPTFTADDVSLTGGLAGTVAVGGADPAYIVTVTLTGTNPDGLTGIAIGTDVQDMAGNGFAGEVSPDYDVVWWPGFAAPVAGAQGYTGDAGPVLDAALAAGGARTPSWQWLFDRGTSPPPENGPTTAAWDLGTLSPAMDGEYWCAVTYGGLPFETNHAVVQVRDRVSITAQPTDQTASPGGSATFTVAAAGGYTPLHYQWKHGGANAPGSPDAAEWTLENVMEADAGAYSVEVSDSHNDSTASDAATLTVEEGVPVAGLLGLAALAGALALAGRRRRGVRR